MFYKLSYEIIIFNNICKEVLSLGMNYLLLKLYHCECCWWWV